MCPHFLSKMVKMASTKTERVRFHDYSTSLCGLSRKILSEQTFWESSSVKKEGNETKLRYGAVNFEKRKHPRFNFDLPIEYSRTDLFVKHGRAVNVSEGGLLLYLPEQMEIGQHLR